VAESLGISPTTFTDMDMRPGSYRIRRNNAKWGPLRRSRSPILVPIESLYTTSYYHLAPFSRYSLR